MPEPIEYLRSDDFELTLEEAEFEKMAAEELGIAGSEDDGFPALLAEAQLATNDAPNVMAGLDSDEGEITDEVPEVQTEHEAPVLVEMADAQAEGDPAMETYERETIPGA